MPHFSHWAWDLPFVGSIPRASAAIDTLESTLSFDQKIPKAVWRGTTWYNSAQSPGLRQKLVAATKNQPWADVQALVWNASDSRIAANAIPIEDFCRYKYIIHTEGVTYSGRFQFLQMCNSIVLTPPLKWLQHTTHLVKPLFSSTILEAASSSSLPPSDSRKAAKQEIQQKSTGKYWKPHPPSANKKPWIPNQRTLLTWPKQYAPEEANIVFVAPDWSDLGDVVHWLEAHPHIAEGIAARQRDLFVGGGYFSPAAEVCYWRALVKGWAGMARVVNQGVGDWEAHDGKNWFEEEGTSYEAWSLSNGI